MSNQTFNSIKERQGIHEIESIINEKYSNMTGLIIRKNDIQIYEKYFNDYTKEDQVHIASVTKSIISILIGIAIDKGYIQSVDQYVLDFFPDYILKRGEKTIQKVTIKELLTMTAPYKFKSEPYTKVFSSDDWTKATLDLLGGKTMTHEFKYTTIGIQILSGVLVSATGESVMSFTKRYLFEPLEIEPPANRKINSKEEHFDFLKKKGMSGWVIDPLGTNTAGWGLTLSTCDLVKIGQLYLNKGIWNGVQLISSNWIAQSTTEKSAMGKLPYGYLWWIIKDEGMKGYAAIGDGGNIIYVSPQENIVIGITSSFKPRAKDRVELIKSEILPRI